MTESLVDRLQEGEHLRQLLRGRDKFIVDKGLWMEFVASLPKRYLRPPMPQPRRAPRMADRITIKQTYEDGEEVVHVAPGWNTDAATLCDRFQRAEHGVFEEIVGGAVVDCFSCLESAQRVAEAIGPVEGLAACRAAIGMGGALLGACEGCGKPPHWCVCDGGPRDSSVCEAQTDD